MNVVRSAINTRAVNRSWVMNPFSRARLSTISSVSPRVFIRAPMTADSRQPSLTTRAASTAPPNFPTTATPISASVIQSSSERLSRPTFVRSPV